MNVAKQLLDEKKGSLEVIDLRSLIPLDKEAIAKSVKKTSKVLVVHGFDIGYGKGQCSICTLIQIPGLQC